MRMTFTHMIVLLVLVSAIATGCGEDSNPGPPVISYPFPDTAEKLMVNFKNAYDEMNIDEYSNVLHSGFIFVFADGNPAAPTSGIYTRDEDLQSTTRMFNGEQGHDEDDQPKAGIRDIEFTQLERLTDWTEVPGTDPYFPGSVRALYDVRIVFYLNTEDENTITVDSQQLFYLQSIDEEQDVGSSRTHFYLIGQQDLDSWLTTSSVLRIDDASWGMVKALYL